MKLKPPDAGGPRKHKPITSDTVPNALDGKTSATGATASKAKPEPKEGDVFGGVAARLQSTAQGWDGAAHEKLEAQLNTLGRAAVAMSDRVGGAVRSGVSLVRGAAKGMVVFSLEEAERAHATGTPYLLALKDVTPELIAAAANAEGLLVAGRKGAGTKLALAVGKPAVRIDLPLFTKLKHAPLVATLDGTNGAVALRDAPVVRGAPSPAAAALIDDLRRQFGLSVTAQASTVAKVNEARLFGADRIRVDGYALLADARPLANVRRYLLESEAAPRRAALENIVALARPRARELLGASGPLPTTFVLGDQAPHSFFPSDGAELDAVAQEMGLPKQLVRDRVGELGAGNSKLGMRGARWAVKDPDLFAAWARAIFEAFADALEAGQKPGPLRLHIPNVALGGEMEIVKARLEQERKLVEDEYGVTLPVGYGAGVDTARGALSTDAISEHVDAIEYSAAELTETLYAISRDDAQQYLPKMLQQGLLPADPFEAMDVDAVGKMIRVGQYLAGDTPNAFPAALSGPQALTANGLFVAAQAGIKEIVVPSSSALDVRMRHARLQAALSATVGAFVPSDGVRDTPSKLFELLLSRNDKVAKGKTQKVPEGTTALEHVDSLQKRVEAGTLTTAQALMSVPPNIVDQLSKPVVDPSAQVVALSKGIAASPGCGQGRVALSKEAAAEFEKAGEPYILVVSEVHADEVEATRKGAGLISVRGGKTSHAAMIASNSEVPCVMEEKVQINLETKTVAMGRSRVKEGDWITVDGTKGQILSGKVPLLNPTKSTAFASLMKWADEHRTLEVLANADTPQEAATAFARGAQGVGLVRSEHMFYEADRLSAFRSVILSEPGARRTDMAALEKAQTDDYTALFVTAGEKKVAVRLLDPPLYEFLPQKPDEIRALAASLGVTEAEILKRINGAQEVDSMLGMRGVRLALVRPDIEAMQVRALASAWVAAAAKGPTAPLHIIVPQVSEATEMAAARTRILDTIRAVEKDAGVTIPVKLGSMIETPRAALEAHDIAQQVDFFSYGTNDLTQATLGYGRNVAAKFIPELIKAGALHADPTESLDDKGVVKLMRVAEFLGHDANPDLFGGVCGGQAGDPASIDSVQAAGLKYISVSPGQVAKARLAAGQAAVKATQKPAPEQEASASPAATRVAELRRSLAAITTLPTAASDAGLVDYAELQQRRANALVRVMRSNGAPAASLEPLMRAVVDAAELLDTNRLAQALNAEASTLRAALQQKGRGKLSAAAQSAIETAQAAARSFGEAVTSALSKPRSSGSERESAAQAWKALRAFEAVRAELIRGGHLPAAHQFNARLWHHNDGWDNQHYTNEGPRDGESMIAFMKRAATDFLEDNNLEVLMAGIPMRELPADRPIILAVAHRSGAIDRFVTLGALGVADDELMYVVRKGSPYDVIAKKSFDAEHNPVLAPESADELIQRASDGFKNGKRVLLTYPQGTGSIAGESRYPATSTVRLALQSGAVIVPVTTDDSFDVKAFGGGHVTLRLHAPIDPEALQAQDGAVDVEQLVHTLLRYELGSGYRARL